jgi:TM2 domain-containing membrane protein YozV
MEKMPEKKKKKVAYSLALFLGGLGAHCFYLNKPIRGLCYLLFCWTGIPYLLGWMDMLSIHKWMKKEEGNATVERDVIKQIGESLQQKLAVYKKESQTLKQAEEVRTHSEKESSHPKVLPEIKAESNYFYDEQSMVLEEYRKVI